MSDERSRVAIHEAGHYWVSEALGGKPIGAQIRDDSSGVCFAGAGALDPALEVAVLLGGRIAEQEWLDGSPVSIDGTDAGWLRAILQAELRRCPESDLADLADVVLLEAAGLAAEILQARWADVCDTADELLDRGVVAA